MADPHVLYVVSTIVVLALVAWVIVVNATAPPAVDVTKAPPASPERTPETKGEAKADTKADTKPEPEPKPAPEVKPAGEAKPAPKPEAEAKSEPDFPPERPSRAGLRNYDEIQDEPKGGDGSGEG